MRKKLSRASSARSQKGSAKPRLVRSSPTRAGDNPAAALLHYCHTRESAMIETIRHLVEMESPSNHKKSVDNLGERLVESFAKLGAETRRHHASKFGNHLEIKFRGASKRDPVLLLGHFDTVWELGTLKVMPFRQADGRLWGPGVLDMKAGIAQMLFAIEALKSVQGGVPRPVQVLLVTDEEVGSPSSRAITESIAKRCSAVLVCEPSFGLQGAVKTARKGVGNYTLTVHGRAAHSGLDFEKGASAVLELSRQIADMAAFTDIRRGITVNPGVIRGGTRSNVVAAEASVDIDVRVAALSHAQELDRKLRRLASRDTRCTLALAGGINRPPMERTAGVAALCGTAQKAARDLGWSLQEASVGGGSDGNFTAALGIPTLDGLGAVGEGAHATNESILTSELARRTALLARLIDTA